MCSTNLFSHFYNTSFNTREINAVATLTKNIDRDYRVKFCLTSYIRQNGPTLNVNSIDTFSSLVDQKVTNSLKKLGFDTSSNSAKSYGGTLLSDIIVGNKYIVTEYPINNDYIKLLSTEDTYHLYENTLCQKYLQVFDTNINLTDNIIENQNNLYRALGGTSNLLNKISAPMDNIKLDNCNYNEKTNTFEMINDQKLATINFNLKYEKNTLVYCKYANPNTDEYVYVNGFYSPNGIIEIPENSIENDITFANTFNLNNLEFFTLDTTLLNNLNILSNDLKIDKGKFSGNFTLDKDSTVIMPFVDIEGYSIFVNGEKTTFSHKFLDFMTLDLKNGENNIEIKFHNPSYKWIIIGLICGLALASVGYIIFKLINKFSDKFINIAFNGFSIMYLFIFILFPFTIFIMKLINVI